MKIKLIIKMKSKEIKLTSKIIPKMYLPFSVYALHTLNDGRIAMGGDQYLTIYNMKTYKMDLKIKTNCWSERIFFIFQLSDNKLFYYTFSHETEAQYVDDDYYNYLIELSENTFTKVNEILPDNTRYNIIREYSDKILFGGINYTLNREGEYCTNAYGNKRIERLEKIKISEIKEKGSENNIEKENTLKERYQITHSVDMDFVDFIVLNNNMLAVLFLDKIDFYDVNDLKKIKSSPKIKLYYCTTMSLLNEKLILIGTTSTVEIFDYENLKIIKTIFCSYPVLKIHIDENKRVFVGETNKCHSQLVQYEIDNEGNYKQIYLLNQPHKFDLVDFTKSKDGRLLTCSNMQVKIWK